MARAGRFWYRGGLNARRATTSASNAVMFERIRYRTSATVKTCIVRSVCELIVCAVFVISLTAICDTSDEPRITWMNWLITGG